MRILVTGGATGFLGASLAARLAASNEVITVGRRPAGPGHPLPHVVDDVAAPTRARYPDRCDIVVHMAALLDDPVPGHSDPPPRALFDANVASVMACTDLAESLHAGSFVLGSSGGVYGWSPAPLAEDAALRPVNFYGHSKVAAEYVLRGVRSRFGSTLTARYFMPLGPGGSNPLWRYLISALRRGRPVPMAEPGRGALNPIDIEDAGELTVRAMTLPGHHTFNIAGRRVVTQRELADLLAGILGVRPIWEPTDDPGPGCVGDISAVVAAVGWEPQRDLLDTIRSAVPASEP